MALTLRYFEGCPHWKVAETRVRAALACLDRNDTIVHERIETSEDAARVEFRGSPTVLIDGTDPFDADAAVGLSCRIYTTEEGTEGAPSVRMLVQALAAERGATRPPHGHPARP